MLVDVIPVLFREGTALRPRRASDVLMVGVGFNRLDFAHAKAGLDDLSTTLQQPELNDRRG